MTYGTARDENGSRHAVERVDLVLDSPSMRILGLLLFIVLGPVGQVAGAQQGNCHGIEVTLAVTRGLPPPKLVIRNPKEIRKLRNLLRDLPEVSGASFQERLGVVYLRGDENAYGFPQSVAIVGDLVRKVTADGRVRFLRDKGDLQRFLESLPWKPPFPLAADDLAPEKEFLAPILKVTIRPLATEFHVGDLIPIEFTIRNVGTKSYTFFDRNYDRSGRMHEYKLVARTESQEAVSDPLANRMVSIGGGLGGSRKLRVGEHFTKTIPLNRWALVNAPGRYLVTGYYLANVLNPDATDHGRGPSEIHSNPIEILVKPRTPEEMHAYIRNLEAQLRVASSFEDREPLLERLVYTSSPYAVPLLLETWYWPNSGFWEAEGLRFYIPRDEKIKRQILAAARRRGLANFMQYVLDSYGITTEEMRPLIERSLAAENPILWANGALAAQIYAHDGFTARLIELAEDPSGPARSQAIYALAFNRTEESVRALRRLLEDPDESIRRTVAYAIRAAYHSRGVTQGRPLLQSDFDERFWHRE